MLNAAACVLSGTNKFDTGLTRLLHNELGLHWLDIPDRVTYKLSVMMFRCLHASQSPLRLVDYCRPVIDIASRQRLR